jgi:hypothetical protein
MDRVLAPRNDPRVPALRVYRLADALTSIGERSPDTRVAYRRDVIGCAQHLGAHKHPERQHFARAYRCLLATGAIDSRRSPRIRFGWPTVRTHLAE